MCIRDRNKAVDDGGAVHGVAGGVLDFKFHLVSQRFGQSVLKALGRGVEGVVLNQLADTHNVCILLRGSAAGGHGQQHHSRQHNSKYFFHMQSSPFVSIRCTFVRAPNTY